VLSALMADTGAWRVVEAAETPVRRGRAKAAGVVVPAYGPDKT
jgi:hypothetical protein